MRELLHEEDRERARIAVENALANHGEYDIEYRVRHADKSEVWIAAKGHGIYADDGSTIGNAGFCAGHLKSQGQRRNVARTG